VKCFLIGAITSQVPEKPFGVTKASTATYIYTSPDGLFAAGIWTCAIGKFRIDFGRAECPRRR
jgi:uncharacterized cupin superfamily protein